MSRAATAGRAGPQGAPATRARVEAIVSIPKDPAKVREPGAKGFDTGRARYAAGAGLTQRNLGPYGGVLTLLSDAANPTSRWRVR